MEEFKSHFI